MNLNSDISVFEFYTYLVIWFSSIIYAVYCFSVSTNENFQNYRDFYSDFQGGWTFLNRKKDNADIEWRTMKLLWQQQILWLVIFLVIQEILKHLTFSKAIKIFQICFSCVFISCELGVIPFGIILIQPLTFWVISFYKKKYLTWSTSIFLLLFSVFYKMLPASQDHLKLLHITNYESHLINVAFGWSNLACVSVCLDSFDQKETPHLVNLLSYTLHLSNLFSGPFILYQDFKHCYEENQNSLKERCTTLLFDVVRFLFWCIFADFMLHYVYVNVTGFYPEWVQKFDSWSLYGYGFAMGSFFHLKYVVSYGLSISIMKFENIKTPTIPICIAHVHLYSNMWKYFDVGLYNFLFKYIYLQLANSKIITNKVGLRLICFIHVFMWHGIMYFVLVWGILNFLAVTMEQFAEWIYCNYIRNSTFRSMFNDKTWRVMKCSLGTPLLAISIISNFYFFAGLEIGNLFMQRIFTDDIKSTIVLLCILYCCAQVSIELTPKRTIKNKEKCKTIKSFIH